MLLSLPALPPDQVSRSLEIKACLFVACQVASAATLAAAGLEGIRMIFEQLDQQVRLSLGGRQSSGGPCLQMCLTSVCHVG